MCCDRPVPLLSVLRLLSLPWTERGGRLDSVCTWFFKEVMVERRLVTFSLVARLAWEGFSVCAWLARVTLSNSSVSWACLEKWA